MHGSGSLIFLVILVIVFYFLLILPQRRQQKKKAEMVKQLSPGAKVMTASGIYAEIAEIHDDIIVARVAEGVEMEMDSRAVVRVISEGNAFREEMNASSFSDTDHSEHHLADEHQDDTDTSTKHDEHNPEHTDH